MLVHQPGVYPRRVGGSALAAAGVTIGLLASAAGCGGIILWRRAQVGRLEFNTDALLFKVVAGLLVGLSTWTRYVAFDLAPVAMVLAITQVSVPTIIVLSPLISGRKIEQVTREVWTGAALIVGAP